MMGVLRVTSADTTLLPTPVRPGSPTSGVPAAHRDAMYAIAAEGGSAAVAIVLATSNDTSSLRIVWANGAALRLLGTTADELLETTLTDEGAPQPGAMRNWVSVVSAIVTADSPETAGGWHSAGIALPDQSTCCVQVMVAKAPEGLHVVWLRPVSAGERAAEEAQRESDHRFRALAENAPIGIVVSEAGLRLGFVNNCFAQIVGIERSLLVGTQWLKSIHPDDLPGLLDHVDQVLAGIAVETRLRLLSIADGDRWVQLRLSPVTTPRRSAGFIGSVEDVTARQAWETQLAYQVSHDILTGLANRRHLVDSLTELLQSRGRIRQEAAVLFCDLDGFKQINDTLGHDAGDRVLIEVGRRLRSTTHQALVARFAGDEFAVVIKNAGTRAAAEAAAQGLLTALAAPISVAGRAVQISASVGIAMAAEHDTPAALLHAADLSMYEAKRSGGGRHHNGRHHRGVATIDTSDGL